MASSASRVPEDEIEQTRQTYNSTVTGRPTASGITDAGGAVDPYQRMSDGSYELNPIIHARNMDPYRGDVTFTNYKGEKETVPFWQADRAFSANLGLIGFQDITDQLNELTENFSDSLAQQTEIGYRNLAEQTGNDYVGLKHGKNDREQRWG
jgi:hypothetical protein